MILKNNKIIIVLNVIMLLIVTGLSTYAYHKQKSYSNQKIEINNSPVDNTKNSKITLITNSSTNFKNENDLNKKFEIFKKLINDKNEILDSKDDEISSKYNDTISQMKEELKSSIKNTIKENTLDSQALSDAQKLVMKYTDAFNVPMSPHKLRHSYGTKLALKTNGNIPIIMTQMGHSNSDTSMLYINESKKIIKQSIDKLDD